MLSGRKPPPDMINRDSSAGRSDKMADGSAGAEMATTAQMTRWRTEWAWNGEEGLRQRTRALFNAHISYRLVGARGGSGLGFTAPLMIPHHPVRYTE